MPLLIIKNFSCVQSASIELRRLNVIIGPQGSGKSVTTKLIYFFADLPRSSLQYAEDGVSLSDYKKQIQKIFSVWFPPSAWGSDRFHLNYVDKKYSIRVLRRTSGGNPVNDVTIKLSAEFEESYKYALSIFEKMKAVNFCDDDDKESISAQSVIEHSSRVRSEAWNYFKNTMGIGIINNQTFIPAGRAFFTSIGRLVAGIEHGGSLDPATLRFAKLFANMRDRFGGYIPFFPDSENYQKNRNRIMIELFGGSVQSKRDSDYIEMRDGRKVPFSSLSSGQQEILPIWYFLDNLMRMDLFFASRSKTSSSEKENQIIYIEEPEAHLFPESQSRLLDILVEVVLGGSASRYLFLTTHSPYIMSRINVFLKAGQISRRKKKNKELNEIVDRSRWLQPSDINALCIDNGSVKSIMDDDLGLIDAQFLDSISDIISAQFDSLLDLEDSI